MTHKNSALKVGKLKTFLPHAHTLSFLPIRRKHIISSVTSTSSGSGSGSCNCLQLIVLPTRLTLGTHALSVLFSLSLSLRCSPPSTACARELKPIEIVLQKWTDRKMTPLRSGQLFLKCSVVQCNTKREMEAARRCTHTHTHTHRKRKPKFFDCLRRRAWAVVVCVCLFRFSAGIAKGFCRWFLNKTE